MSSIVSGVALNGLEGKIDDVETHIGPGLIAFTLVGLPDTSLRESKERVRAALQSCGIQVLDNRVTVNLSPAGIPKTGSGFDLAIALSILLAAHKVDPQRLQSCIVIGELALDGRILPVTGVLPAVIFARTIGIQRVIVAAENAREAGLIPDIEVEAFTHLADVIRWCGGACDAYGKSSNVSKVQPRTTRNPAKIQTSPELDIADVHGQNEAIEALAIAAAGGHHLHFVGEPGSGKTMLARRLPGILPPLDDTTALLTTAIHSLSGTLKAGGDLITVSPFQAPHHSTTMPAMIGGGSGGITPGAVSLAHGGVLFLDEAPEFQPAVLDGLRQPLEEGEVEIHRSKHHATFPARFQLILASNPCPCGGKTRRRACTCSSLAIRRYRSRLSGPLLDRIDITVPMHAPSRAELSNTQGYTSEELRERVICARERSQWRLKNTPWGLNRDMTGSWMRKNLSPPTFVADLLADSLDRGLLTMRGCDRILRLLWTVCDFNKHDQPTLEDFNMALSLRNGGTNGFN